LRKVSIFSSNILSRFDGRNVVSAQSANFEHRYSSLGRYRNTPMAIGGYYTNTVESLSNGKWNFEHNFPFGIILAFFSTVTLNNNLYIFGELFRKYFRNLRSLGGQYSKDLAVKYDGNNWTIVGDLAQGRFSHRSVVNGNTIMHIGGQGDM